MEVGSSVGEANDSLAVEQERGRVRHAGLDFFRVLPQQTELLDQRAVGVREKAQQLHEPRPRTGPRPSSEGEMSEDYLAVVLKTPHILRIQLEGGRQGIRHCTLGRRRAGLYVQDRRDGGVRNSVVLRQRHCFCRDRFVASRQSLAHWTGAGCSRDPTDPLFAVHVRPTNGHARRSRRLSSPASKSGVEFRDEHHSVRGA